MGYHTARLESSIVQHAVNLTSPDGVTSDSDFVDFYMAAFRELNEQQQERGGADEEEQVQVPFSTTPSVPRISLSSSSPGRSSYFSWPVFEMVEFEFGGEADGIILEYVLIVTNLPSAIESEDSDSMESSSTDLSSLLRLMLEKAGTVR